MEPRPIGLTVLAILFVPAGLLNLALGILALTGSGLVASAVAGTTAPSAETGDAALFGLGFGVTGLLLLLAGILSLVSAAGFWTRRTWGWLSGLALSGVLVLLAGAALVTTDGGFQAFAGLLFAIVLALYLAQPRIRAVFRRSPGATIP